MLYNLLLDSVLIPKGSKDYTKTLRTFPFLPSQPRIQGLLYYLKSYSISEHVRQSVVILMLLRYWLRKKHLRLYLLRVLEGNSITDPIGYIVSQFVGIARSNSVLISLSISVADREDMYIIVYSYRANLQQLLLALSQSIAFNKRRSRSKSITSALSRATILIELDAAIPSGTVELSKKAEQYLKDTKLPNIYVAVYYPATADKYSLIVNCNSLLGKDKHRGFKKQIYSTNYRHLEKDLIIKENLRQTLRLILANRFKEDKIATELVKDVYRIYLTLFGTVLLRSKQISLETDAADDDKDKLEGLVSDLEY